MDPPCKINIEGNFPRYNGCARTPQQLQPQAELHITGFLVNIMTRSGGQEMEGAFDG